MQSGCVKTNIIRNPCGGTRALHPLGIPKGLVLSPEVLDFRLGQTPDFDETVRSDWGHYPLTMKG